MIAERAAKRVSRDKPSRANAPAPARGLRNGRSGLLSAQAIASMGSIDFPRAIRPQVYNVIQSAMNDHDLPTMASLPVDNADDGNTLGPTEINGEEVDPLPFPVVVTQDRFSWHFG
jgi:hypothetical protein